MPRAPRAVVPLRPLLPDRGGRLRRACPAGGSRRRARMHAT